MLRCQGHSDCIRLCARDGKMCKDVHFQIGGESCLLITPRNKMKSQLVFVFPFSVCSLAGLLPSSNSTRCQIAGWCIGHNNPEHVTDYIDNIQTDKAEICLKLVNHAIHKNYKWLFHLAEELQCLWKVLPLGLDHFQVCVDGGMVTRWKPSRPGNNWCFL